MILIFLAKNSQLTIDDMIRFCIFVGITTIILYIGYINVFKGNMED